MSSMDVDIKPGKYVVAVSGGVDSVVLLDVLHDQKNIELIVAHFDHGIRGDSHLDAEFVKNLAEQYGLKYAVGTGELGANASEQKARQARYEFLHKIAQEHHATAIITAHHSDDMLETALINMSRGTGRKGLSSLKSTDQILRPILNYSKDEILKYATDNNLIWREDSTNQSEQYLRNRIRKKLSTVSEQKRKNLLEIVQKSHTTNAEIDSIISGIIDDDLSRKDLIMNDYIVSKEILAEWLRMHNVAFDRNLLNYLLVKSCTARAGTIFILKNDARVLIDKNTLRVV